MVRMAVGRAIAVECSTLSTTSAGYRLKTGPRLLPAARFRRQALSSRSDCRFRTVDRALASQSGLTILREAAVIFDVARRGNGAIESISTFSKIPQS